jgi:hypothetical protein
MPDPSFEDWKNLFQQIQDTATGLEYTKNEMTDLANQQNIKLDEMEKSILAVTIAMKKHRTWHSAVRWCIAIFGSIVGTIIGWVGPEIKWRVLF